MTNSVIGSGAIVLDGAKVESRGILAAGSLLSPGKTVSAGQYWAGSPARYVRDVTASEVSSQQATLAEHAAFAQAHAEENAKPWQASDERYIHTHTHTPLSKQWW